MNHSSICALSEVDNTEVKMNPELFVKLVKLQPLFHSLPVETDTCGLIYCSPKLLSLS